MSDISASGLQIDRASPLPFYHQLKEILRDQIEHLDVGDKLPNDRELCERFDVSRTVVRQAMGDLHAEGLVAREKGRGTFVAPKRTAQSLIQLTGLYEDVAALGQTLISEIRRFGIVAAPERIADRLEIAPGTEVVQLVRLRSVDGDPWVYTVSFLPADLVPGITDIDMRARSLYNTLRDEYGLRIDRTRRSVEAHLVPPEVAVDLHVPVGSAVLRLASISYTADRPVEDLVALHRGDRSRFDVDLSRSTDGLHLQPNVRLTDGDY